MEYLAGLYTRLLVAICLELAVVLWRTGKKTGGGQDTEELKRWMQQQLDAQAKDFAAKQSAMAEQNYTAMRGVSETLQTAVQNMSATLAQGQDSQQQILERRLRSLEASNTQKLEELRKNCAPHWQRICRRFGPKMPRSSTRSATRWMNSFRMPCKSG